MKKYLLLAMAVVAALAGCKKQEQSMVDFADLTQKAVVKGVFTYDAGFVKKSDGTKERNNNVPIANVKVVAKVVYQTSAGVSDTKLYTCTTNSKGEYSFTLPVQNAKVEAELSFERFKANYLDFVNNQWIESQCYYSKNSNITVTAEPAITTIKDIYADNRETISSTKKDNVKFNVNGTLLRQAEIYDNEYQDYIRGQVACTYSFTIRLQLIENSKVVSTILYAGNCPSSNGKFSVPVAIYNDWNIANVRVSVFADKTEKVTDFAHMYYEKTISGWPTSATKKSTQYLSGTYLGGTNNVLTTVSATDNQLYFDLQVGDVTLKFQPEDKNNIYGIGNAVDYTEGGDRRYKGGLSWPYNY